MKIESESIGLISVLYYKCYNASLLGNFKNMEMYFNLMENEYKKTHNKYAFQSFFTPEKLNIFKLIKQQVEMGKFFEVFEEFVPVEQEIEMNETEIEKEALIVKHVAKNQTMLEKFLGGKIKLKSIECPCGSKKSQDKCDMVSQNDLGTLFPIEFKLSKATHAVVGQIGKYCLNFKLQLINRLYDRVQGVVIANSYSKFAINELHKRGIICLIHFGDLDHLRLRYF